MGSELVTVATFNNPAEATIARNYLEGDGVPAFLLDEETVAMTWGTWFRRRGRWSAACRRRRSAASSIHSHCIDCRAPRWHAFPLTLRRGAGR